MADINIEASRETAAQAQTAVTHPDFKAEEVPIDTSVEESVKATIAHATQLFGRIDYAVHSAGVSHCLLIALES